MINGPRDVVNANVLREMDTARGGDSVTGGVEVLMLQQASGKYKSKEADDTQSVGAAVEAGKTLGRHV